MKAGGCGPSAAGESDIFPLLLSSPLQFASSYLAWSLVSHGGPLRLATRTDSGLAVGGGFGIEVEDGKLTSAPQLSSTGDATALMRRGGPSMRDPPHKIGGTLMSQHTYPSAPYSLYNTRTSQFPVKE